ncbi:MAG: hypothetical protein R3E79_31815 [Caldilineaceae bacterium]
MVRIEEIAAAAWPITVYKSEVCSKNSYAGTVLADVPQPATADRTILALSAAFLELLGERAQEQTPDWTTQIGPVQQPIFLLEAAARMPRLRNLCEQEAPEPLRKRKIYAPPNYLALV